MKTSVGFPKIALSVALFVCSSVLLARDLGVVGPVYPIAEQDMLQTIEHRLTALEESGELTRIEEDAKARYQAYVERPEGVQLPRATKNRTYYVDPSLTVPYDIKDHQGRIIHPAGTTVNPLDHMTLSKKLLFFDGDDPVQVEWARAMVDGDPVHIKPILTNGPVLALMKDWQVRLYFDQRGQLVERFQIQRVPALVASDGSRLKVREFRLGAEE
jgi:conjugal transfer pilus assembly protein TraW